MKLNQLRDNEGSRKLRKRVGRGIGSGTGKTASRGLNGQKSRSGVAIKGFEGGQMPIHRRLPKRGFKNIFRKVFSLVNLQSLQAAIEGGKLDGNKAISIDALVVSGLIGKKLDGVKLLAKGELKEKITIEVNKASKTAIEAVEKAGGSVKLV